MLMHAFSPGPVITKTMKGGHLSAITLRRNSISRIFSRSHYFIFVINKIVTKGNEEISIHSFIQYLKKHYNITSSTEFIRQSDHRSKDFTFDKQMISE